MLCRTGNTDLHSLLRTCRVSLIKRAARAYVVGPELTDALEVRDSLSKRGFATTLGFRNREDDPPRQTAAAYCHALAAVAQAQPNCYLSVKAPALAFAPRLLAPVVQLGQQHGIRIHFDALGPETADPTFALIAMSLSQRAQL